MKSFIPSNEKELVLVDIGKLSTRKVLWGVTTSDSDYVIPLELENHSIILSTIRILKYYSQLSGSYDPVQNLLKALNSGDIKSGERVEIW
jgi:hypothetical protein